MSIVTAALTSVLFTAIFHFRRFLPEYSTSLLILTQSRLDGFSSCLCYFLFEIRRVLLTRCVWQGSYSGIRRNVFRYRYFLLHLKCFHTAILMSNFWQRASVAYFGPDRITWKWFDTVSLKLGSVLMPSCNCHGCFSVALYLCWHIFTLVRFNHNNQRIRWRVEYLSTTYETRTAHLHFLTVPKWEKTAGFHKEWRLSTVVKARPPTTSRTQNKGLTTSTQKSSKSAQPAAGIEP